MEAAYRTKGTITQDCYINQRKFLQIGQMADYSVDDLLAQASIEPDSDLSLVLYQEAEQRLVDDAAALPLWFGRNYVLVKPYVQGYKLNPLGYPTLNTVIVGPH